MNPFLLAAVLGPAALVVAALVFVLWREAQTARGARTAFASGSILILWSVVTSVLAYEGAFQRDVGTIPAVGINLAIVLPGLAIVLTASSSLRGLLTPPATLIRLHLWRLEGIVFLVLMMTGHLPALFSIPAGIGDILIAVTAPWVARDVVSPAGRRRAVIWNLLGMADLVIAVSLGIMTSPGPAQVFRTTPTSEFITTFPLVLVPALLVPLALTLHVVSLWQLLGAREALASTGGRRGSVTPALVRR
jgi:hypothetical protein